MNTNKLIKKALKAKEAYTKSNNETKQLKTEYDALLNELLDKLTNKGIEQIRTEDGVAYRTLSQIPVLEDKKEFLQFVFENNAIDLVPSSVNSVSWREYVAEHNKVPGVKNGTRLRINLTGKIG